MANVDVKAEIENIVKKYAEILLKEMNVEGVYLFGSYANGNYSKDSDIDVAVIAEEFTGDIVEDTFRLMKLRRKVDNRIEPHPIKKSDINNPFVQEILKKGLKII